MAQILSIVDTPRLIKVDSHWGWILDEETRVIVAKSVSSDERKQLPMKENNSLQWGIVSWDCKCYSQVEQYLGTSIDKI